MLDTQDPGQDKQKQKHNTTQKTKTMSNTDPPKTGAESPPCAREG